MDQNPVSNGSNETVDELLLELSDPCIKVKNGKRRASATARLVYTPGKKGKREIQSQGRFRFTAPIGPIEQEELSWYLERYASWPTGVFKQRAQKVETQLPLWGKALYDAVLDDQSVRDVLIAWKGAQTGVRRFTVSVDAQLVSGAKKTKQAAKKQAEANEAATLLMSLPWELLHDNEGYLFQDQRPVRVRRRLPFRISLERTAAQPPIRVLLVSPRPEDDSAGYIDHRVSALPLVTALESLGDMVRLTVLSPATFPALEKELEQAKKDKRPYHVVHFNGHGVYRKDIGLGGLCFEDPQDGEKLVERRSQIIFAKQVSEVIRRFRVPLVFLEACQSAKAEDNPTASVAAELLDKGVASVVAMSHLVLVETARRFVEQFYLELVKGSRVGEAMLAGQRALKTDTYRLKIFGAGSLYLEDWFVPVLYQEKEDVQLLTRVPSRPIEAIDQQELENSFGALPPTPEHQFIGRSRELLKLERLLVQKKYAVLCGQGGEGKTTLAVELARWLVRTSRFDRAVFVSVEDVFDVRTVVDRIGQQLVSDYSVAGYSADDMLTGALLPIERELRNQRVLIVLDNMESILPTAFSDKSFSGGIDKSFSGVQGAVLQKSPLGTNVHTLLAGSPLPRFEPEALQTFFALCKKLQSVGGTRLLFTSRESLPEPFAGGFNRVTLSRLDQKDAVELVHKAMTFAGLTPKEDDLGGTQPEVEALVEAVNCHARSLVLLAPSIGEFGVQHTTENLGALMAELHKQYPDERERSLFASVELSLRRLSPDIREKLKPLGVFQGGGSIAVIALVLELEENKIVLLVSGLVETGLAELMPYNFLRFHPALCPYLLQQMNEEELSQSKARWTESMRQMSTFLYKQQFEDAQLSATLTTLELPNLMHLLEVVQAGENPEVTVSLATSLEQLLAALGRKHLLAQVVRIREEEVKKIKGWSHTRFESSRMQIERLLGEGNFPLALNEAQSLLERCLSAGEEAFPEAAYDTAMASILLGRVLKLGGAAQAALQPIQEAHTRFQRLADLGNTTAARMVSVALTEKGGCLFFLGRLAEAAAVYETGIKISENTGDSRGVAVKKGQLGSVRLAQRSYNDALTAYGDALRIFETLGEPSMVAASWHQVGMVHEEAGDFRAAESAYRQALSIRVRYNLIADEASNLGQLGNLYFNMERFEEALIFYRQAVDKYVELEDLANEGRVHLNISRPLIMLNRCDEARREIQRAIECDKPYGHAAQPWKTWIILCDLETAEGNPEAAAQAREKAIDLFLAYRRDGGENHDGGGRLCLMFLNALLENKNSEMETLLAQLLNEPNVDSSPIRFLIPKLQAILDGSRDPGLADDPELNYRDAAEVKFLLGKIRKG